jgi:predicted RNA-binding protein YlxR (DUF448 family)
VGCRRRAAKDDLLRVAVAGETCVPDPRGTLPGRGAHVHPDTACLDLAVRRKAFPRAFRVQGPLEVAAVRAWVEQSKTSPSEEG